MAEELSRMESLRMDSSMELIKMNSEKENLTICFTEADMQKAQNTLQANEANNPTPIPTSPPLLPSVDLDALEKNAKPKSSKLSCFWKKPTTSFREEPDSPCAHTLQSSKDLQSYLKHSGLNLVTCPNKLCGCIFEKANAGTDIDPNMIGINGKPLDPKAIQDYLENRFRCRECMTEFCASCLASPYHSGFTCKQFIRSLSAKCRFCGSEVDYPKPYTVRNPQCSFCYKSRGWFSKKKMVRCARCLHFYHTTCCANYSSNLKSNNGDAPRLKSKNWMCGYCEGLEVCNSVECSAKAYRACARRKKCGHFCIGVRDEWDCPPCLHPDCMDASAKAGKQCADDFCNICWTESLGSAPCIVLTCGHIFHYSCIHQRLKKKWSGASISFTYLKCPLCSKFISHPLLALEEDMSLFNEVKRKAIEKLVAEGMQNDEAVVSVGGRFYDDLAGYAMHVFAFYRCYYCTNPYYGGKKQCEADGPEDLEVAGEEHRKSYICQMCSSRVCPLHGESGLMFKCRFCCSIATWFCFGNTHYCDVCHQKPYVYCDGKGVLNPNVTLPVCPGPDSCPLGIRHPPHGVEFAFRCALCEESGVVEMPKIRVEVVEEPEVKEDKGKEALDEDEESSEIDPDYVPYELYEPEFIDPPRRLDEGNGSGSSSSSSSNHHPAVALEEFNVVDGSAYDEDDTDDCYDESYCTDDGSDCY